MSFSRAGANNNNNQQSSASSSNNNNNNNNNNSIPRPPQLQNSQRLRRNEELPNTLPRSGNNTPRRNNNTNNNDSQQQQQQQAASTSSSSSSVFNRLAAASSTSQQQTRTGSVRAAAPRTSSHRPHQQQQATSSNSNNNRRAQSSSSSEEEEHDDDEEQGQLWIAVNRPSPLYAAPNGPQVGESEVGTIIEEYSRTTDMFGAEWIASVAVNSESAEAEKSQQNFSYIWVRRFEKGDAGLHVSRTPLWEMKSSTSNSAAADSSSTSATTTNAANSSVIADPNSTIICNPSYAPFSNFALSSSSASSNGKSTSATQQYTDFSLILQYMEVSKKNGGTSKIQQRDWNTEYQQLLEELMFGDTSEEKQEDEGQQKQDAAAEKILKKTEEVRLKIHNFYSAFAEEIGKTGVKIVEELSVSLGNRTVKPFYGTSGSLVLGTYFHNGIMYRMNVDSAGGAFGGDRNAMKIANQILKANNFVATAGPLFFFHQPLVMILTFRGFRITASTIPPLRPDGLLVGSMDGGKAWTQPTGFFNTLIDEFAEHLGLASHQIKPSSSSSSSPITTPLPFDSCIIGGYDQRFYTMNIGRFLPPIAPIKQYRNYNAPVSNLFWRLRPELVNRLDFKLSSDAFVPNASHVEDNEDVVAATSLLRDHAVPSVAAVFGFLEPTLAPTITLEQCVSCKKTDIEGHLIFTICEAECCKICPQCYLQIQKTAFWDGSIDEAEKQVKTFISQNGKCQSLPRTLKGFIMTPDVTSIMHAHGVNLRYLNIVYQKIPRSAFHCTGHYLEIEMIARTAQHMLSEILRKSADNDDANQKTAHFFVSLLQPFGPQAERFWAEQLGPSIVQQFDVSAPFDTEHLDRDLVYRRLSELCGVQFSPMSVKSLLTEKPFVQMLPPQPVLKHVLLPSLVDVWGERKEYCEKYSGLLQVYWSEKEDKKNQDGDEMTFWKGKRPLHFSD